MLKIEWRSDISFLKKYLKNIFAILLFLGGMAILFLQGDARYFVKIEPKLIFSLLALNSLFFFSNSIPFYLLFKKIGVKVPFSIVFNLQVVGNFLSWILPARGGVFYRGQYLKVHHNLSFEKFSAVSLYLSFCSLLLLSLTGSLTIGSLNYEHSFYRYLFPGLFLIGFLVIFVGVLFGRKLGQSKESVGELLSLKVLNEDLNNFSNLIKVATFYLISLFLFAFRIKLVLGFFFVDASWAQSMGMASFIMLFNSFPLLPGNIGIREFAFSLILNLVGQPIEMGIFVSMIDRIVEILFLGVTGLLFTWRMNIFSLGQHREDF